MIQSLYSASTSVRSHQANIDTISNNIANINTYGFKASRMDFKETLHSRMESPTDNTPQMNLQLGHGAIPYQTLKLFDQGVLNVTGIPTDMALSGAGFFTVMDDAGNVMFTRDGNFSVSLEQDGNYLVDKNGNYLLDVSGSRILVSDVSSIEVGEDGTLRSVTNGIVDENIPSVTLSIVNFDNPQGLVAISENYYAEGLNSGAPRPQAGTVVRQGALEVSNVDLSIEITRLIRAQRAMQIASRAITTADDMAGIANNIRT